MSPSSSSSTVVFHKQQGRQSLTQLLNIRDEKRKTLHRLFDEKKKIQQQMDDMNKELLALDDQIEALEDEQESLNSCQQRHKHDGLPYVKHEEENENPQSEANTTQMTMNAEEILTDQPLTILTQQLQQQQQQQEEEHPPYGEQLTDPITWTQTHEVTPPLHHHQHQQRYGQNDDPDHDAPFDLYANDESFDQAATRHHHTTPPVSAPSSRASDVGRQRVVPALHPLQVVQVLDRNPTVSANPNARAVGTGTLDSFLVPTNRPPIPTIRSGTTATVPMTSSVVGKRPAGGTTNAVGTGTANGAFSAFSGKCPFSQNDILRALNRRFQKQSFRENQLEVIQSTLSGKDCFVLMKTGGGKSLTYQLPAVLESPKVTLVVSPLLSLIQDQEDQMNQFVRDSCVSFTSGMGRAVHTANWDRVRDPDGGVALILVTPEMVSKSNKLKAEMQRLEEQNRLGRFVIDECHCACQWGHDFRPDYAKLSVLRQHFPHVPILAVTATASEQVRRECVQIFGLTRDCAFFRSSADRPNLIYQVRPKESPNQVIEDMCSFIRDRHPRSAGIVYTYSKKDADTVADQMCEQGIIAESYHSDVSASKKSDIHKSWMRNETQVIVATIAFGLGINKPDVRFVLHHTLSKTLEAYYQESGRAGRDGKPSDCVLYYSPKDVPRMIKMIHGESSEDLFSTMVKYAQQFGDDRACRALILQNMGEPNHNVNRYMNELNETVEMRDVTSHATTLLQLMHLHQSENMTMAMLVKEWRQNPKDAPECIQKNPPGKDLSPSDCERIIVGLLVNDIIQVNCRYTAYDTVVYLVYTPKAQSFILSDKASMKLPLPKKTTKSRLTKLDEGGWVTTKRKRSSSASESSSRKKTAKKKGKVTKAKTKKPSSAKGKKIVKGRKSTAKKTKAASVEANDQVIEIIDDSDADSSIAEEVTDRKLSLRQGGTSSTAKRASAPNDVGDSEEEDLYADDDSEVEWDE